MVRFDLRGSILPFSMLRISNYFKGMRTGEVFEVVWSDPGAPDDLLRVLPASAYEVLTIEEIQGNESQFRMRLRKKQAEPEPTEGGTLCQKLI
jgi:TusA-related sulfurtransferase